MDIPKSLAFAKPFEGNPRTINRFNRQNLKNSMKSMGDLSGIVINVRSNQIISGNQRSDILDIQKASVQWEKIWEAPTKAGTVAIGHTYIKGEPFRVRLVDWDEVTERIANIAANKIGGFFDFDELMNNFEVEELLAGGFQYEELSGLMIDDEEDDEPEWGSGDKDRKSTDDDDDNDFHSIYRLVLHCRTEEEVHDVHTLIKEQLEEQGYDIGIDVIT